MGRMDRREQIRFLEDFFASQTEYIPSKVEIEKLIDLEFANGKPVLNFDDTSERIEVLAILKKVPLSEAILYFAESKNFQEMVLESPLMSDIIKQVKLKRDILSRGTPGAKDVFGKCPHCKHNKLKSSEMQTRSADEGIIIRLTCTKCRRTFPG